MPEIFSLQFWPSTFFASKWRRHPELSADLITYLEDLESGADDPIVSGVARSAKPAQGLFESDFDLFTREHEGLQQLRHFIDGSVRATAARANGDRVPADQLEATAVESWFHITRDGGFHDAHGHSGCSWCCVYYLQLGEVGRPNPHSAPNGGTRFYSPLIRGGDYRDYGNAYLTDFVDPPIEEGMLLIFPSYLVHSALPYRGITNRIVVACNYRVSRRGHA